MRRYGLSLVLSLTVATPAAVPPVAAQEPAPAAAQDTAAIQWWHGVAAVGGVAALSLLDESLRRTVQDHRSASLDDVALVVRRFGQPEVYLSVTGGLYAAGLISGNTRLAGAGSRLVTALGIAAVAGEAGKEIAGRARPDQGFDSDEFAPFSGRESMPSGHTTMAFALATALSHDLKNPWATAGLYTMATAVGWSRINDDDHWLSDVAAGAVLGITAANVADGHWRIFHLRPPHLAWGLHRARIGWEVPL